MSVQHDDLTFERLGHASVRIETGDGLVVYVDPWSEVLEDDRRDGDVVFVTHDDFDHYDPDAIDAVASDDADIVVYDAVDTTDLDRNQTALAYDESITVRGVDVQAVPAHNRADGEHVDDDGEPFHAEHEGVGLLLGFDGTTVYFTGDTDFLQAHNHLEADVFVPPIGGHYTMDRHEAAEFAESVDPDLVLPVHYDTFDAIETDAGAFIEDVEARGIYAELF
ncbi:hydrolase [Halobacterium sp. DL1]|jgi:L-ascorbate metabolism protein UlaG (beta-lactamase superfamily)|nr:hydrolase [Halobacterium sp. DL1]